VKRINHYDPLARYEIASGSEIHAGELVALNSSGKAVPAADAENLRVIGVAWQVRDGEVAVETGIFALAPDTVSALSRADRGKIAYVKDKTTVSASGGTNSVVAGVVVDVYDGEVYVAVDPVTFALAEHAAALVAAHAAQTAAAGHAAS